MPFNVVTNNFGQTLVPLGASATAAASTDDSVPLSDDVILEFCQTRLSGLDTQVDQLLDNQKAMQSATSSVNDAQALFQQNPNGLNYAQAQQALASLTAADNALPAGNAQKASLETQMSKLEGSIDANPQMKDDSNAKVIQSKDVQGYSDALGNVSKDIGNEAEMQMLTLQSLISQRQNSVQEATNLISSLDDTQKAIAEKIGA